MTSPHNTDLPNELFFGRPDYVGPDSGYGAFIHHGVLFEKSHSFKERVDYIKREKPKNEVATRLHNLLYLPFMTDALYADYKAKLATLDADILAFIRQHIPDCAWNGQELVFPGSSHVQSSP
jgi:hypothetical protein